LRTETHQFFTLYFTRSQSLTAVMKKCQTSKTYRLS